MQKEKQTKNLQKEWEACFLRGTCFWESKSFPNVPSELKHLLPQREIYYHQEK